MCLQKEESGPIRKTSMKIRGEQLNEISSTSAFDLLSERKRKVGLILTVKWDSKSS